MGDSNTLSGSIDTGLSQARRMIAMQREVMTSIEAGQDAADIFSLILSALVEQIRGSRGQIHLADLDDPEWLRLIMSVGLQESFAKHLRDVPAGDMGTPVGRAARVRTSVISLDIDQDRAWKTYRDLAHRHEIKACWAFPILYFNGKVAGTLSLYFGTSISPTSTDWEIIDSHIHVLQLGLDRIHSQREISRLSGLIVDSLPPLRYKGADPAGGQAAIPSHYSATEILRAVENGEFFLQMQPRVNSLTGEMTSAEALVRWLHPEHGLIMPAHFIPAAERTGTITSIGRFVCDSICRQLRQWTEASVKPIRIAMNVSAQQFLDDAFIDSLETSIYTQQVDARYLEIEVTESTLIQNTTVTARILSRLRGMGVKIAVDDFGVGYSSLGFLKYFPVDILKIDRIFIQDVTRHRVDQEIVKAVINLGQGLTIDVIAEGVETPQQLDYLQNQNCFHIQGYLYSRPVSVDEITELMKTEARLHP